MHNIEYLLQCGHDILSFSLYFTERPSKIANKGRRKGTKFCRHSHLPHHPKRNKSPHHICYVKQKIYTPSSSSKIQTRVHTTLSIFSLYNGPAGPKLITYKTKKERKNRDVFKCPPPTKLPKFMFTQMPFCQFPIFLATQPCFLPDLFGRGLFGLCLLHRDNPFHLLLFHPIFLHQPFFSLSKTPSLSSLFSFLTHTYINTRFWFL